MQQKASDHTVILYVGFHEDCHTLRGMLNPTRYRIIHAATFRDALEHYARLGASVVMCDQHLPDGSWHNLLELTGFEPGKPRLIVCSTHADERLWAEVLNLGGHDVLAKPFRRHEAAYSIETALPAPMAPVAFAAKRLAAIA